MNFEKYLQAGTPQSEPIPGTTQVQNSAGGFSWVIDCWKRLDRFLILGSEGGSYYAAERKLTTDNLQAARECLKADAARFVQRICEISDSGRAPKNDPAILCLALALAEGDDKAKRLVRAGAIDKVCRIGTHILHFTAFVNQLGGWGPAKRKAIRAWYDSKPVPQLAYQAVKYQNRDGWTHRDVLRLTKPRHAEGSRDWLYHWITRGEAASLERHLSQGGVAGTSPFDNEDLQIVHAFERAKEAASPKDTIKLIVDHGLPRECVRTEHFNDAEVWNALLNTSMKPEGLVRNLGKMTAVGLLKPLSAASAAVVGKLQNHEWLQKARLHPIKVLTALLTYKSGHGVKGSLTWQPVPAIIDALDAAFYGTFPSVVPTGKPTLLGLDISGSMDGGVVAGVPGLSPRLASAAMALVVAATEKNHAFMAFTTQPREVSISPRQRLDDVVLAMQRLANDMGRTDCAQPMLWAMQRQLHVESFQIYTDSETWAGNVHPAEALRQYRRKAGLPAKLAVVGMVANDFTIADPNDAGMMDVVGFDTAAPQLIADFVRG